MELAFFGAAVTLTIVLGFIFIPIIRKAMKDE